MSSFPPSRPPQSLPEALEPRQKSVTDVGLGYAACTKPVFGSGDRPRVPPAITGPLDNPKPQMGYLSGSITGVAASIGMRSVRRNLKYFFVLSSRSIASQHAAQAAQHSVVASFAKLSVRRN